MPVVILEVFGNSTGATRALGRVNRALKKTGREGSKATDKLTKSTSGLGRGLGGLMRGLSGAASVGLRLFTSALKLAAVAAAALLGVLAAGVAIVWKAVKTWAEYEKVLVRVQGLTSALPAQMKSLDAAIIDIAVATRFMTSDIAAGAMGMAQLGASIKEIETLLPIVADFATAMGTDLASAAEVVLGVLRAYRKDVGEAVTVTDMMTAAAFKSALNFQRMASFISNAGSAAGIFGQSLETSLAVGMRFSDMLINAQRGGTLLKTAFARMSLETKKFTRIFKKYGITFEESNIAANDFLDVLNRWREAGVKAREVIDLMGVRAGPLVALLMQMTGAQENVSKTLLQLRDRLRETAGTTETFAAIMRKPISAAFERFAGSVKLLWTKLGEVMTKAVPFGAFISKLATDLGAVAKLIPHIRLTDMFDEASVADFADWFGKAIGTVTRPLSDLMQNLALLFARAIGDFLPIVLAEAMPGRLGKMLRGHQESKAIAQLRLAKTVARGERIPLTAMEAIGEFIPGLKQLKDIDFKLLGRRDDPSVRAAQRNAYADLIDKLAALPADEFARILKKAGGPTTDLFHGAGIPTSVLADIEAAREARFAIPVGRVTGAAARVGAGLKEAGGILGGGAGDFTARAAVQRALGFAKQREERSRAEGGTLAVEKKALAARGFELQRAELIRQEQEAISFEEGGGMGGGGAAAKFEHAMKPTVIDNSVNTVYGVERRTTQIADFGEEGESLTSVIRARPFALRR